MQGSETTEMRRARINAEIFADTGIDEAMIERLVRRFYAKIREDALLAPVFEARIQNWELHLQRMCAFWSSVALMSGRYHGSPVAKHLPLPVDAVHFDRWLELFEETAHDVCPAQGRGAFPRACTTHRGKSRIWNRRAAWRHPWQRSEVSQ